MTKPRIFVQAGQRFGQLVVTDPETRIYTPSSPGGIVQQPAGATAATR